MLRWVSTTPAGVRVEPEVNCRNAVVSARFAEASSGFDIAAAIGLTQSAANESGRASTVRMRGRSLAGVSAKKPRTAVAECRFVSTTVGAAAPRTAVRWAPWPGSVGS
jgi:hypothetical protein